MAEEKLDNGQAQEPAKTEQAVAEEAKPEEKVEKTDDVKETADEAKADEKTENEKEEPKEASPELLKQIKDQMEFYFGNGNMQRDKFLNEQVKLDEGWVPLSVMLNFKMLASLSKDVEVILKALETSELMEISEDRKKVRRSPKNPIPVFDEEYKKAQEERSVYIKGFPQESTSMSTLKEFLAPYEPIEHIYMRRYKDKNEKSMFKGSIFAQFASLDGAKAFMAIESIKFGDTELIRKWSKDYAVEKAKEREELRSKRDKRKENKEAKSDDAEKAKENGTESHGFPKGAIIHIAGLSSSDITREDIKQEISKLEGNVAYIEYNKGNTEAFVRLQDEGNAKTVIEKLEEGKLSIGEKEVTCRVLEGEEETTYLDKVKQEMKNARSNRNHRSRGGRKGFGGKRSHSPSAKDDSHKKAKN